MMSLAFPDRNSAMQQAREESATGQRQNAASERKQTRRCIDWLGGPVGVRVVVKLVIFDLQGLHTSFLLADQIALFVVDQGGDNAPNRVRSVSDMETRVISRPRESDLSSGERKFT
jgi:hypothetical protein